MEAAIFLPSNEMVILEQNGNIITMDKKTQAVINTKKHSSFLSYRDISN